MTGQDTAVARMLRAGATYRQINEQLGASPATVIRIRRELQIPVPDGRPGSHNRRDDIHDQVAGMLRAGATYSQIRNTLRVSSRVIAAARRTHSIKLAPGRQRDRTPADTLALYSAPTGDGHTHWTGPWAGRKPQLWHTGRAHSALRIAFRLHHGREPQGRVTRGNQGCEDPQCITGAHLADDRIRAARHRADQAFEQIFGSTA
ncbi:Trp family transcriptional regulator [Streptomyces bottropensis]|uniref:Trp family transcriptional regulator n=1 Tax=Streptomyces bottropensis TaxID=42235 RepID=UPI0037FC3C25